MADYTREPWNDPSKNSIATSPSRMNGEEVQAVMLIGPDGEPYKASGGGSGSPDVDMDYQGEYNPQTNTPPLHNGSGVEQYVYKVVGSGSVSFNDGNAVVSNQSDSDYDGEYASLGIYGTINITSFLLVGNNNYTIWTRRDGLVWRVLIFSTSTNAWIFLTSLVNPVLWVLGNILTGISNPSITLTVNSDTDGDGRNIPEAGVDVSYLSGQTPTDYNDGDLLIYYEDEYIFLNKKTVVIGDVVESGTNLRTGTGSAFAPAQIRQTVVGQNSESFGNDATSIGNNVKTNTGCTGLGYNIGTVSRGVTWTGIGHDIREIQSGSVVVVANSVQSAGYRTKVANGVIIGSFHNINSQNPANSTLNGGIYIGYKLTNPATNLGAKGIVIANNVNLGASYQAIVIGRDSTFAGTVDSQNSIFIGSEIEVDATGGEVNSVIAGYQAKCYKHPNYGAGVSEGQKVGLGYKSIAGGWRGVNLGAYSYIDQVSSISIGYGAMVTGDVPNSRPNGHCNLIGRGGYMDNVGGVKGGTLLYEPAECITRIGAMFAAHYNSSIQGTETFNIISDLNAGTTRVYLKSIAGVDARPSATTTDTRGSHTVICGGEGTGTAKGGELIFSTTPAGLVSNNEVNSLVDVAKFDTETGVDTRFLLLDVTDDTIKRVEFGGNDVSDPNKKVLVVDGGTGIPITSGGGLSYQPSFNVANTTQGAATSGTAYASLLVAESDMSVSSLEIFITSTASSTCYVGVYSADGNTLLGEAQISTNASGLQSNDLVGSDFNLVAGESYWVAILEGGGSANMAFKTSAGIVELTKSKYISGTPTGMPSNLGGFTTSNLAPYIAVKN